MFTSISAITWEDVTFLALSFIRCVYHLSAITWEALDTWITYQIIQHHRYHLGAE